MIRTVVTIAAVAVAAVYVLNTRLSTDRDNDPIVATQVGDPAIAEARLKAQQTLPDFFGKTFPAAPGTSSHAVKVPLRSEGKTEWVWVGRLSQIGQDRYAGILDNVPVDVTGFRAGQRIEFARADIADWLYRSGDRMAGGYSVCVLAAKHGDPKVIAKTKALGFACG